MRAIFWPPLPRSGTVVSAEPQTPKNEWRQCRPRVLRLGALQRVVVERISPAIHRDRSICCTDCSIKWCWFTNTERSKLLLSLILVFGWRLQQRVFYSQTVREQLQRRSRVLRHGALRRFYVEQTSLFCADCCMKWFTFTNTERSKLLCSLILVFGWRQQQRVLYGALLLKKPRPAYSFLE